MMHTENTPSKFNYVNDQIMFKTADLREGIDDKEVQGKLFQKFRDNIDSFKNSKDDLKFYEDVEEKDKDKDKYMTDEENG